MPNRAHLERQIKAWLSVRNMERVPAPAPEISPPAIPDPAGIQLRNVPRLQGSLERLPTSIMLGSAIPALASLMSVMNRNDAERLYDFVSSLSVPEGYDQRAAANWFRQCHKLSRSVMPLGVTGFFRMLELFPGDGSGMDIEEVLAFWLRALRSSGAVHEGRSGISLEIAERFPDRFGSVCMRISSGGTEIVSSLERFLERITLEKMGEEVATYLLDFTIETGWLLDDKDYDQMWNLIRRRGHLVHGRLSGGLVPVSSIRFLAGILHGIQDVTDFKAFFTAEREHKAMEIFKTGDRKLIHLFLAAHPELGEFIDDQMEMDLVVEAISHSVGGNDHSRIGRSIVSFLANVPGGVSSGKIIRFLRAVGEEISGEVVQFLSRLVEDTLPENRLSPANTIRFSSITARILPVSVTTDRTALKAFYRALVDMEHSQTRIALRQLDEAAFRSGVSLNSILSAASLLARAAAPEDATRYLSRIKATARLIEALSAMDRKQTLSGLAPPWVEALMDFPDSVQDTIVDFVYRISDLTTRRRFLDNVVSRLLEEVQPDDPVFQECLAFAVSGYNSAADIEKIRDTEHKVFQKVLRAGGRIEAVDKVITDLLSIPGFEGNRSRELIAGIRSVCDRFSRLAVWEEGADKPFSDFINSGVSSILRSFVDNPQVLEAAGAGIIQELADRLMPGDGGPDSSAMTNPAGTCRIFFESILPDCVSLFNREPSLLRGFLLSLTDGFTRSIGGMTGDMDFAMYVVSRLDQEIMEDKVMVLDAWISQRTPPPLNLEERWPEARRSEWVSGRTVFENTRMKLFGAVSALVGSAGSQVREDILNTAGFLATELNKANIHGADSLSLVWSREMMEELISKSDGLPPFSLFVAHRAGAQPGWQTYSYLEKIEGFMAEDAYHGWRQLALPPILNCAVEIELAARNSSSEAIDIAEAATSAIEFLGYPEAENFLSTLQQSFLNISGSVEPCEVMERNFLLPLWKRNSSERLDLLMLGMSRSRQLMDILLERLALIRSVKDRIRFMKDYSNLFITVEEALLQIETETVRSRLADALMDSSVFSGEGALPAGHGAVMEVTETVNFVRDVFRRVRYGSGIVSAQEAGEISADMRRKYRDNADSVAIILRWTVDPDREGLLKMLEESQVLLQAAGTDSELMRLLDHHGADQGFEEETQQFAEDPAGLKKYLQARSAHRDRN